MANEPHALKKVFTGEPHEVIEYVRERHDPKKPYGSFGLQAPYVFNHLTDVREANTLLKKALSDRRGVFAMGYNYMAVQPARWGSRGEGDAPEPVHLYICTAEVANLMESFARVLNDLDQIKRSYPKNTATILGKGDEFTKIVRLRQEAQEMARQIGAALLGMDTLLLEVFLDPDTTAEEAFDKRVKVTPRSDDSDKER
jgi:hypothetical protein